MYALLNRLRDCALENMTTNDGMHSYHAAALVGKGNKVLAYGVNTPRGYVRGKPGFTFHAEQRAILNFYHTIPIRWARGDWRVDPKVAV